MPLEEPFSMFHRWSPWIKRLRSSSFATPSKFPEPFQPLSSQYRVELAGHANQRFVDWSDADKAQNIAFQGAHAVGAKISTIH